MAITFKLSPEYIVNSDESALIIKDATGTVGQTEYVLNDNGTYDAVVNTTGYGTTNPDRSVYYLYVVQEKINTDGESTFEVGLGDPATADEFIFDTGTDGWYVYHLIAVVASINLADEQELIGEYGFDLNTSTIHKLVGSEFVDQGLDFDISTLVGTDNEVTSINHIQTHNNRKYLIEINNQKNELLFKNENKTDNPKICSLRDKYTDVAGLLQGAINDFEAGNRYVAQNTFDFLNSNYLDD